MSLHNPLKRSREGDNDDIDVKTEDTSDDDVCSRQTSKRIKHDEGVEVAAGLLQDAFVCSSGMSRKTSLEVLKVTGAVSFHILLEHPDVLNGLSDEQCKVVILLASKIMKHRRCKEIRKSTILKAKQARSWWKRLYPF